MPVISKRITSAAAVAPLAALLATLGPAPAHSRLLLETADLTVSTAATELPCVFSLQDMNQSHSTRNCDDNQDLRCNYRACDDDNTLIEKCVVPSGWTPIEGLPEDAECEVLTTEADGTPQTTGGTTAAPTEEEAALPAEDAALPAEDIGTSPAAPAGGVMPGPGEGIIAPEGTALECGEYGDAITGASVQRTENCPEDDSTLCFYRTCQSDDSLTQKCVVPWGFDTDYDEVFPDGTECIILQNDGGSTETLATEDPASGASAPTTTEPAATSTDGAGTTEPATTEPRTTELATSEPATTAAAPAGGTAEETAAAPAAAGSVEASAAHGVLGGSLAMISAFAAVAAGVAM